ncbi:Streptomyces sporulation and cell division protein, SsgA [Nakamurella panacisegetis]|uniref:Streptomyces sporulation and cell division protein, SsgA n=1 Tax=Nakamurella panacisegetis TaxID=1090615 RepID=A0A1H0QLE4_9ACTN|nr:SsgA family sporulation/cell division regulator [Nakamurella panacisegetis]SDP18144.1 Streptomyces sporulation and cell division protein, SsgA [Nakamurella panacisegetis]
MATQPTAIRHHSVIARTGMTLIAEAGDIEVDAELSFHSRDPFAIRVLFSVASAPAVEWVFSRDLLIDGLSVPAGAGDVQIFPCHAGIVFELSSPSGRARLLADPEVLTTFVQDTLGAVPRGAESRYFDLDLEIALLADLQLPGTPQS